MYLVHRYHDISCGHRVVGHEGKCRHLHGHNYRIHFTCEAKGLDAVGRVIDFSEVKARLCMWLEESWDHKFLVWNRDELMIRLSRQDQDTAHVNDMLDESFVWVPFNPTAENMAEYIVEVVGPIQLAGTGIRLVQCTVEETRKCSASYSKG